MSFLDGLIKRRVREAVDAWMKENVPSLVAEAFLDQAAKRSAGAGYSRVGFAAAIGWHLREAGMDDERALRRAGALLTEFLKDERIKFGDPAYEWDFKAAKTLAHEGEIEHWEQSP